MLLELLQLSDSALPIGSAAHSYGLETLVEEQFLVPTNLAPFFKDYICEAGRFEAVFVRRAWRGQDPHSLSAEFDARRPARESRESSFKTGRRLANLFAALSGVELPPVHYPITFGAVGAALQLPEDSVTEAYLQQSATGLISACQRLMPLGQVAATRLLWDLRSAIRKATADSACLDINCFTPSPELASMRHQMLETRLFIS